MKQTIVFTFGAWSVVRLNDGGHVFSKAKWSVYFDGKFYCSQTTKKRCIAYIENIVKVFA